MAAIKTMYLILGAGPAGLTFANRLLRAGIRDFIVLEREHEPGGLCRSAEVDGAPFDIGGGHFLDVRRPKVNAFLFEFMPEEEWDNYTRDSRIEVKGNVISHPIEANIWQMDTGLQVEYLKSIAVAGCNLGVEKPVDFVDWIRWKLGDRIADDYMLPYNRKMFGSQLGKLGTYWLEKLPNVSFDETLLSCLNRRPYGSQPGHAQFYYPKKYGYGELWKRMGAALGDRLICGCAVSGIDFDARCVTAGEDTFAADCIVTTIPWMEFDTLKGMPESLQASIGELKYSSIQTEYHPERLDTPAHWIYYPDPGLAYHRILVRHNFCPNSRGYWTETNSERIGMAPANDHFKYMNRYAYPLNTVDKPTVMRALLEWAKSKEVYGLGRWGEHQHYNSDATVELAMALAERLSR